MANEGKGPGWEMLGFVSEAEQGELRKELYKKTARDLFAKEMAPDRAATDWLISVAQAHNFHFENTTKCTKEELAALIKEADGLLELRKVGK
jgi:hypothetical protein